jgi:hypothetical protein
VVLSQLVPGKSANDARVEFERVGILKPDDDEFRVAAGGHRWLLLAPAPRRDCPRRRTNELDVHQVALGDDGLDSAQQRKSRTMITSLTDARCRPVGPCTPLACPSFAPRTSASTVLTTSTARGWTALSGLRHREPPDQQSLQSRHPTHPTPMHVSFRLSRRQSSIWRPGPLPRFTGPRRGPRSGCEHRVSPWVDRRVGLPTPISVSAIIFRSERLQCKR